MLNSRFCHFVLRIAVLGTLACDLGLPSHDSGRTAGDLGPFTDSLRLAEVASVWSEPMFGKIHHLARTGDLLWVNDLSQEPFLHAVDYLTGRIIRSMGRTGRRVGEFYSIAGLFSQRASDSTVWAWDYDLGRLSFFDASSIAPLGALQPTHSLSFPKDSLLWLYPRGRSGFLGTGHSVTDFFVLLNESGRIIRRRNLQVPDSLSSVERTEVIVGVQVCPNWDRSGFAVVFRRAPVIQFYDSTATFKWQYGSFSSPVLTAAGSDVEVRRSQDNFFLTCAFSASQLFAVYAGPDDFSDDSEGSFLFVLQEGGRVEKKLRLSSPVGALLPDSTGSRILATSYRSAQLLVVRVPST